MVTEASDEELGALVVAIHAGDLAALAALVGRAPELVSAWIPGRKGTARTPLHVVTDWPGYFPDGPRVARMLLDSGADPNLAVRGADHAETPLHWAASSDDSDVAAVLIDGGADLEAPGGSIAGTPLGNAVGYGCWHVARLLVARGARIETLWQAAALGAPARIDELLAATPAPTQEDLDEAFWQACHGGQRRAAERLLGAGADLDGRPGYAGQSPLEIAGEADTRTDALIAWLREQQPGASADA